MNHGKLEHQDFVPPKDLQEAILRIVINQICVQDFDVSRDLDKRRFSQAIVGELNTIVCRSILNGHGDQIVSLFDKSNAERLDFSLIESPEVSQILANTIVVYLEKLQMKSGYENILHCMVHDFVPNRVAPVYIKSCPTEEQLEAFCDALKNANMIDSRTKATTIIKAFNGHNVFNQTFESLGSDKKSYPTGQILWIGGKRTMRTLINKLKPLIDPLQHSKIVLLFKDIFVIDGFVDTGFDDFDRVNGTASVECQRLIDDAINLL